MHPKIPARVLIDLIEERRFGVEYQPLVSLADETIMGYEALARFYHGDGTTLAPQQVFDSLHASPLTLYKVEYEMKRLQLVHAPTEGLRLFVNLDPDAFESGLNGQTNPLVTLLAAYPKVVVEIIENSTISDAEISETMASAFADSGVELALDDIGATQSMLSLEILLAVDFLKFDRSWLQHLGNPVRCALLRHLVAFARECGKSTILEGVESEAHHAFAQSIGFDYVQGFLYLPLFRSTGCLAGVSAAPPLHAPHSL
jgi:EAL domain-containing protein (putative c-di-GMP-specific phosphodiesterase class I)